MRIRVVILGLLLLPRMAAAAVEFEWVTVGSPGNACDPQPPDGCFGSVPYWYQISVHEVTNAQYAAFLNAVAKVDPNGLFVESMQSNNRGGIIRTTLTDSFFYAAKAGQENEPVNFVMRHHVLRFANWLHNGQPEGTQDSTTTEDGAYTLSLGDEAARNPGAIIFVPNEEEWYKAAYYAPLADAYFDYPTSADVAPDCVAPTSDFNRANCTGNSINEPVAVGSYPGSPSPSGTMDQGGNIDEWTETLTESGYGIHRGGAWNSSTDVLGSDDRRASPIAVGVWTRGFRVARFEAGGTGTPVPALGAPAVVLLGIGLLISGLGSAPERTPGPDGRSPSKVLRGR